MSGDRKAWAGSLLCPPGPHGLSFTFRIQSILVPVNAPEAGTKPLEGRPSACGDPPATPPLVFEPRPLTPDPRAWQAPCSQTVHPLVRASAHGQHGGTGLLPGAGWAGAHHVGGDPNATRLGWLKGTT